jgi:hypothetical protein
MKCNYKRKPKECFIKIIAHNRNHSQNNDESYDVIELSVSFRVKKMDNSYNNKYYAPNLTLTQLKELLKLRI